MRELVGLLCGLLRNCTFEFTANLDWSCAWRSSPLRLVLWRRVARSMGCCASKAPLQPGHPLDGSGVCHKQLFPAYVSTTGLQVGASTASWVSTLPFLEFCQFRQGATSLFLACFEPRDGNKAAAAYATDKAYQVFNSEAEVACGDVHYALQSTFSVLDNGFKADAHIAGQDRALATATGTIVFIDFSTEKVWLGQIGQPGNLVLGQLFHGLAVQRTKAVALDTTLRDPRANSSCIGAGAQQVGLTDTCIAHITEQRLHAGDEHLIIATQAFWDVVSADDAALLMHFHLKVNASQVAPAVTLTCDTTGTPLQAAAPPAAARLSTANAAESLILYAMSKVAAGMTRSYKPKLPFSDDDMKGLALQPSSAGATAGKHKSLAALTRRDVHGDMSAVVLSLRWPATSLNQALEMPMHTPPAKGRLKTPEQQAAAERAQYRWRQIKMLHIDFHRARRVMLLSKWWKAVDGILAKGRVKARQLEEQLWVQHKMAVKVSPALHIVDQYGRIVHPEDIDLQLPDV